MKKIVSLLLVFCLLLACVPAAAAATPFRDVPANAWYAADVEFAYENGLVNGMTPDTFAPNAAMTRAMMVTLLWRFAGQPEAPSDTYNVFDDVNYNGWYGAAVRWANGMRLVLGVDDRHFAPNLPITREQMVTLLQRYALEYVFDGLIAFIPPDLSGFADADQISHFADIPMKWGIINGLVKGSKEGKLLKLNPKSSATRAEVSALFRRFITNFDLEVQVPTPPVGSKKVGISMPTRDLYRWNTDGLNMKDRLAHLGYAVDLQFAANDIPTQIAQIENMIAAGCDILVIAPIDGDSLRSVLLLAKEVSIPVIAYDRLIMNSDAVSYFVTFNNFDVGVKQGQFIEAQLDLPNAGGRSFNIEFIAGDPGDYNARLFYEGAMSVLQKYLNAGVLKCVSGQRDFTEVATAGWATYRAQERFENVLATYYADGKPLHAICASNDSTAQGVAHALASTYQGDIYPILTGQDCDIVSVQNIVLGKQTMSVFKDTRDLTSRTASMVNAILHGEEPPINDTTTYHNGVYTVPTYLEEARVCTLSNLWNLLIESGYYSREELGL